MNDVEFERAVLERVNRNEVFDSGHPEATDTLRPPPPAMPKVRREPSAMRDLERRRTTRPKTFPVIVRCETEEQRAMLVDWLAEAGFDLAP